MPSDTVESHSSTVNQANHESDLVTLRRSRGALKRKLTTLAKHLDEVLGDKILTPAEIEVLERRQADVRNVLSKFYILQDSIELHIDDEDAANADVIDAEIKQRVDFEQHFYDITSRVSTILKNACALTSSRSRRNSIADTEHLISENARIAKQIASANADNARTIEDHNAIEVVADIHPAPRAQISNTNSAVSPPPERVALTCGHINPCPNSVSLSNSNEDSSHHKVAREQICLPFRAPRMRMPEIKLPIFSGEPELWLEFRDKFLALIHNDAYATNIEKFHYLKSVLQGEAGNLLQSVACTSEGYELAWTAVCARYDNPRVLLNNHLKAFFKLESIGRESANKLRFLHDNFTKHINAIKL